MQHQIPDEIRYLLPPSVVWAHEMMGVLEIMEEQGVYRQVIDDATNRAIGLLGVLNTVAYPPPAERPNVWQRYLFELDRQQFKDEFCIHPQGDFQPGGDYH